MTSTKPCHRSDQSLWLTKNGYKDQVLGLMGTRKSGRLSVLLGKWVCQTYGPSAMAKVVESFKNV